MTMLQTDGNVVTRWEYLLLSWSGQSKYDVSISDPRFRGAEKSVDELVNDLGELGWEMVNVYYSDASGFARNFAWFKRPRVKL